MLTWTPSAEDAFARHLQSIFRNHANPAAATADLRKKLEAELRRTGVTVIEAADVARVLAVLQEESPPYLQPKGTTTYGSRGWAVCGLIVGVVLPWITLVIELATGMCREAFFDPVPTPWHAALVALVGVGNLLGCLVLLRNQVSTELLRWAGPLNGVVLGLATWYSLWFAPIMPIAVIGIAAMGLGLLPLSPAFSLGVAIGLRLKLRSRISRAGLPGGRTWPWFLAAIVGLLAVELPALAQSWAIHAVASHRSGHEAVALSLLRSWGDEDELLRRCYSSPRREARFAAHAWLFGEVSSTAHQEVFYRVTGRAYNHQAPPDASWSRGSRSDAEDWVWDNGLGGDRVSQRLKSLALTASRLDAKIDGDAATGYLEWTMVFRNDHAFQQREARALVQLPPGGVVSRLTLWIDGEEREAAFGERGGVRRAYQAVVNQRRDPVLVTTRGQDRVLLQCFPIAPDGGEMKVRVGITLPLTMEKENAARLVWPRLVEQNFGTDPALAHAVWVESPHAMHAGLAAYSADRSATASHVLRAELTPAQFSSGQAEIEVARDPGQKRGWTTHPALPGRRVVQTLFRQETDQRPLGIVVDGSSSLGLHVENLAQALSALPDELRVQIWVAGDATVVSPATSPRQAGNWLRGQTFVGGADATHALQEATEAMARRGGSVLWLHGAQPVRWQEMNAWEQTIARRKEPVPIAALGLVAGENVLAEKLEAYRGYTVLGRSGDVARDLRGALARFHEGPIVAKRTVEDAAGADPMIPKASAHLARLWAAGEIRRLARGTVDDRAAAVKLAVQMQLVTPVSGAVVLETKQQYDAAGLQPVDRSTVPTVPESGVTLLLLAVSCAVLGYAHRRCKRAGAAPVAGATP